MAWMPSSKAGSHRSPPTLSRRKSVAPPAPGWVVIPCFPSVACVASPTVAKSFCHLERRIISRAGNAPATQGRAVAGIIDGAGQYCARVAAGGPLVFFGTTAVDAGGKLAGDAIVEPPYHLSPAAHAVHQGHAIFRELAAGLTAIGSGLEHILQVEQFTPAKAYADGYITTRGEYLAAARPTTALAATGALLPEEAVVCTTGTAVRPGA